MKVKVDRNRCEGNVVCVARCPEVFELGDDDVARVKRDPDESLREKVEAAVANCPRQALTLVEGD